jgi:hypothetical protein
MFWLGVLTGLAVCLALLVLALLTLIYVFPQGRSESIFRFVREKVQEAKDDRTRNSIRRSWPQMDDTQVHWLFRMSRLEGGKFEKLIAKVYSRRGYQVTRRGGPGDRGIDLIAGRDKEVVCIQCKSWDPHRSSISSKVIRDLMAAMQISQATKGVLLTTAPLSKPAKALASQVSELEAIVGPQIIALMDEAGLLPLDEDWWSKLTGESLTLAKPVAPLVSYPLPVRGTVYDQAIEAELLDVSGQVRYSDEIYSSPSAAGKAASGWKSCNGWTFWHYRHPETDEWRAIDELRGKI